MKLLWFYTTQTYESFSASGGAMAVDEILKVDIVQHAFQVPFLMNTILGLSAMHLNHLNQEVSPTRAIAYRARAFEGYRKAIEAARPETFPALLACSLFLCALSTDQFRSEDAKPLYVLDWMPIWKGMGLIITMIQEKALFESGMATLFFRPPINLNSSAKHIPSNLLFMVTSIQEGDVDFGSKPAYYHALKFLGSLYAELARGFSVTLILRVVTFFTFLRGEFFDLARNRRPRALVIIAHFLTFAKTISGVWWMEGISDREICNIYNLLGKEWESLLRVPRMAVHLTDRTEIGKLLLDNHAWEPPSDLGGEAERPTTKELAWTDNEGKPVQLVGEMIYKLPLRERQRLGGLLENYEQQRIVGQEALVGQECLDREERVPMEVVLTSLYQGQSPDTTTTSTPSIDGYGS